MDFSKQVSLAAMIKHYAHSGKNPDRSDWQSLNEHLDGVAGLAAKAAAKFGAADLARAAGLLHDAGKYSAEFQKRLSGNPGRGNHSTAGARRLSIKFSPV